DCNPAALNAERVGAMPVPEPPADRKQPDAEKRDEGEPQLDRNDHPVAVHDFLHEKADAEYGEYYADLDRHVAGREPLSYEIECALDRSGGAGWASGFACSDRGAGRNGRAGRWGRNLRRRDRSR